MEQLTQVPIHPADAELYLFGLRVEVTAVLVSLAVGVLQIGLIVWGLILMHRAFTSRNRQLALQLENSQTLIKNNEVVMRSLETVLARMGSPPSGEAAR